MHRSPKNTAAETSAHPAQTNDISDNDFAYYFAYGSNMSQRYLSKFRNVQVHASHAAALPGYRLAFNLPGIIPFEPAFANLIPDANATAHGVIHRIAIADFPKIFASELENYGLTTVQVHAPSLNNDHTPTSAQTLTSDDTTAEAMPSRRYLRLLIAGAVEQGLPEEYIEELRDRQGLYVPFLSECAGAFTKAHVYWNARQKLGQKR